MKQELELKGWDMVTKERNSDKRIEGNKDENNNEWNKNGLRERNKRIGVERISFFAYYLLYVDLTYLLVAYVCL